ncbi:MAG: FAD-binding oxidoreductase [Bdellovibrionota bacterium]
MRIIEVLPPVTAAEGEQNRVERVTEPALISEKFSALLGDESKVRAESVLSIVLPKTDAEVSLALAENTAGGQATRLSGARTGLAAGAVPEPSEHLVSLERLKSIGEVKEDPTTGERSIRVGAGVTLNELNQHLRDSGCGYYFPVDPTETWAALGGMTATNASGARSYHYGAMRNWILALDLVLIDGSRFSIRRGEQSVVNGELQFSFRGERRTLRAGTIPKPPTKNTLGYSYAEGLDAIDVFIGSEGTLAACTGIELRLAKLPENRLYYLQFFSSDESALAFVAAVRSRRGLRSLAIEFLDRKSLELAKTGPSGAKNAPAQMVTDDTAAAVYLEIEYTSDDDLGEAYGVLEELLADFGADSSASFAGITERELAELKTFRHAVPEHINSIIAKRKNEIPALHKIATDMAVPDSELENVYRLYRSRLDALGLEYAIFGHAGNNHFHVNILPRSAEELAKAKAVYLVFADEVVRAGGAVAAEHGIGRLKKHFLKIQYGASAQSGPLAEMAAIKRFFDPNTLLNRGVLFDYAQ